MLTSQSASASRTQLCLRTKPGPTRHLLACSANAAPPAAAATAGRAPFERPAGDETPAALVRARSLKLVHGRPTVVQLPDGLPPRNTASRWLANEEDRHSLDGFI